MRRCGGTQDLFKTHYAVRPPAAAVEGLTFDVKLKRSISQALKECSQSREEVAAAMAAFLGQPSFSKHMLDAYSAESREAHKITVERFLALVHVTGALWLLDKLAEQLGCHVVAGEDAHLTELGRVERELAAMQEHRDELLRQSRKRGER